MAFKTNRDLHKKIDMEKADELINRASADIYHSELPTVVALQKERTIRKNIVIPEKVNYAFLNYMILQKKNGVKTNFNKLVVELLKKHLKDYFDR